MPYFHWIGRSASNRVLLGPLRLLLNLTTMLRMLLVLRRNNIDVVYSNTLATPVGAMLARAAGLPHVWHIREFLHEDMNRKFDFPLIAEYFMRKAAAFIYNSEAVRAKWSSFGAGHSGHVVYNGFDFPDPDSESGEGRYDRCVLGAKPVRLLFLGGIRPQKGPREAIRALSILRQQGLAVVLDIVGDGPSEYRAQLESLVSSLDLAEAVTWHGFVKDPAWCFKDAALSLVCSKHEAFGRVAVEAMSWGVPVVGTAAGGLPEILGAGRLGLLYPPGNSEALADGIAGLLHDRARYAELSEMGAESVRERYAVDRYVEGVSKVIAGVGGVALEAGSRAGN
jgi:glycosyltransferase involved in cell wall biosynthesis